MATTLNQYLHNKPFVFNMLEPDDRSTFAVWKKSFKNMLQEYNLVEIQDEDGADFILEVSLHPSGSPNKGSHSVQPKTST